MDDDASSLSLSGHRYVGDMVVDSPLNWLRQAKESMVDEIGLGRLGWWTKLDGIDLGLNESTCTKRLEAGLGRHIGPFKVTGLHPCETLAYHAYLGHTKVSISLVGDSVAHQQERTSARLGYTADKESSRLTGNGIGVLCPPTLLVRRAANEDVACCAYENAVAVVTRGGFGSLEANVEKRGGRMDEWGIYCLSIQLLRALELAEKANVVLGSAIHPGNICYVTEHCGEIRLGSLCHAEHCEDKGQVYSVVGERWNSYMAPEFLAVASGRQAPDEGLNGWSSLFFQCLNSLVYY